MCLAGEDEGVRGGQLPGDSLEEALGRLGFSDVGVEGVAVGSCV